MRHPEHDAVAAEVASWYTTSSPGMGLLVEERWCGVFTTSESQVGPRVVLRLEDLSAVSDALAEVRATYPGGEPEVWVEGREAAARLREPLLAGGCVPIVDTVYLALVGEVQAGPPPPWLRIEVADRTSLQEWVEVKQRGFDPDDRTPDPADVEAELALRRTEIVDVGRFWLARQEDGEAVGVVGFYEGDDVGINVLATLLGSRSRGVARSLLAAVADGPRRGSRSVLIWGDDADWPVQLYRRLGFSDEIGFHARFAAN